MKPRFKNHDKSGDYDIIPSNDCVLICIETDERKYIFPIDIVKKISLVVCAAALRNISHDELKIQISQEFDGKDFPSELFKCKC